VCSCCLLTVTSFFLHVPILIWYLSHITVTSFYFIDMANTIMTS
jgi:hypothetical protein